MLLCCSCSQVLSCLSHARRLRARVLGRGSPTNVSLLPWGGTAGCGHLGLWKVEGQDSQSPGCHLWRVDTEETSTHGGEGPGAFDAALGNPGLSWLNKQARRLLSGVWELIGGSFIGRTKHTGPGLFCQAMCPRCPHQGRGSTFLGSLGGLDGTGLERAVQPGTPTTLTSLCLHQSSGPCSG